MSPQPIISRRLVLSAPGGRSIENSVRTELGKPLVKLFGSGSEFWDTKQCFLDRDEDNRWVVIPVSGTANDTLLNGEALTGPRPLKAGDQLAVGRQAKGIVKLPITVRGI